MAPPIEQVDENHPATQNDLAIWGGRMTERIDALESRMATKHDLDSIRQELQTRFASKGELATFKDEIVREFRVVAENIHQDVVAAGQDERHLLATKQLDHEQRLRSLERAIGRRPD